MANKTTENAATVEEAIEKAGSRVLGHLGSRAHKLNREEVKQYEEDNGLTGQPAEGEHRAYDGPYDDVNDPRNAWTAAQDAGETTRTGDQLPPDEDAKAKADAPKPKADAKKEDEQRRRTP